MRTRGQVNAYREVVAQHRREAAAFAAAIAASMRAHEAASSAQDRDVSNAPSAVSNGPQEPTNDAYVTPEKKTRKRKLSLTTSASSSSSKKSHRTRSSPASSPSSTPPTPLETTDISPAQRDITLQPLSPTPSKTTKAATIRRTLDYDDKHEPEQPAVSPIDEPEKPATEAETPTVWSPRVVLERVASGEPESASIVGRADEQLQVERVFAPTTPVATGSPPTRALFVIGPPGTGKSSCVAHVAAHHANPATAIVRLNCSTFTSPLALMDAISEQLLAHKVLSKLPSLDHTQALDTFLSSCVHAPSSSPSSTDCVLVLDEVDHLVRLPSTTLKLKAQNLLKFFVRWAHLPNATLRFIGILNGVDMHAQIAEFLVQDPNPTSVVLFPSYTLDELVAILTAFVQSMLTPAPSHKLQLCDVVEPRALELIARKVAARDGDARRAVGLLRQCARTCLGQADAATSTIPNLVKLTVRDVLKCTSSAIASQLSVTKQIQQLPRAPKLLLYAVTRLAPCDTATASLNDICDELQMLQATQPSLGWIPRLRLGELQQHLGSLECYALIKQTATKSKSAWHARLTSTITMDTLMKSFHDDELLMQLPTHK